MLLHVISLVKVKHTSMFTGMDTHTRSSQGITTSSDVVISVLE